MGPDPNQSDIIYQRFRRWDFSRLYDQKKQLEGIDKVKYPKAADNLVKLEEMTETLKAQGLTRMPNLTDMINKFPSDWKQYVYIESYLGYCMALHSDFRILHKLVQYDEAEHKVRYSFDLDENTDRLLLECVSMCNDVNLCVRDHFKWSTDLQQREYERLAVDLEKDRSEME